VGLSTPIAKLWAAERCGVMGMDGCVWGVGSIAGVSGDEGEGANDPTLKWSCHRVRFPRSWISPGDARVNSRDARLVDIRRGSESGRGQTWASPARPPSSVLAP
jgi:hypothetical protein